MTVRQTGRWRGIVAVALGAIAVGLIAKSPALLLLAILGIGFAGYARLLPPPAAPDVAVERDVSESEPEPDEEVTVTLTIRNAGSSWLVDLRVIDGVPGLLEVVEGGPRLATALPPGGTTSVNYTVTVPPGKHRFAPVTVLARNLSGTIERTASVEASTVIDCLTPLADVPLGDHTSSHPGPIPTAANGRGVEFDRTREYRPGDSLDRIDWRQYARSGQLSTIEFRPERAASVMVAIDLGIEATAASAFDAAVPSDVLARTLAAADRFVVSLAAEHHAIGLAACGRGALSIPPDLGAEHVDRLREALDSHPLFGPRRAAGHPSSERVIVESGIRNGADPQLRVHPAGATDEPMDEEHATANGGRIDPVRSQLDRGDQVLFLTPLLDDQMVGSILSLQTDDDRLLVVCPDVGQSDGPGGQLVTLAQSNRIRSLRAAGVPVIEWQSDDVLATTLLEWIDR